ncbi:uncharacterized protein LOC125206165 [Salvia hispanica]|uniref:uncharacterized protein LOC125206165 n=1 Tax=Salvia hispanica TaxID=49212 RepID=UPI0020098CCE|nr:uncharacterized protein LOC125206165 [Salvia hispanica]
MWALFFVSKLGKKFNVSDGENGSQITVLCSRPLSLSLSLCDRRNPSLLFIGELPHLLTIDLQVRAAYTSKANNKNCLGALDGTHVEVSVPLKDQGRYRNRKGSAADSPVLRDALVRKDPFIVPKDAGYTNGPSFLAPYRGIRYHLNEWYTRGNNPQNPKELYNLRHATARNVIERAFGLFKKRWKILREVSFYDVKTHVKIINACAILHNLIRVEEPNDPLLAEVDAEIQTRVTHQGDDHDEEEESRDYHNEMEETQHSDRITTIQVTNEWTRFRDSLAEAMFLHYQNRRN